MAGNALQPVVNLTSEKVVNLCCISAQILQLYAQLNHLHVAPITVLSNSLLTIYIFNYIATLGEMLTSQITGFIKVDQGRNACDLHIVYFLFR